VLDAMLARAGYVHAGSMPTRPSHGGFVETPTENFQGQYCNGSTVATFATLDSVRSPLVVAMYLVDGEGARQTCGPERSRMMPQSFPVTVPRLSPPAGAVAIGASSSFGGSRGNMTTTLRTTMPTDSILAHYTAQLAAGGWKAEGRPAVGDGAGVQRFSFREGQDAWTAALIVLGGGSRREVLLQVTRAD